MRNMSIFMFLKSVTGISQDRVPVEELGQSPRTLGIAGHDEVSDVD